MKLQLSVISVGLMNADTVSGSNREHISRIQQQKDGSEYAALWYAIVNRGGRRVLITNADPLLASSHETSDPRQYLIANTK